MNLYPGDSSGFNNMAHPAALLEPVNYNGVLEHYKHSYFYDKPYLVIGLFIVWMLVFGMLFLWVRRNRQ